MANITLHIYLNETNAIKVHAVRHSTDRSANDIVNQFIAALDAVEIEEIITLHLKPTDQAAPPPIRKRRKIKTQF